MECNPVDDIHEFGLQYFDWRPIDELTALIRWTKIDYFSEVIKENPCDQSRPFHCCQNYVTLWKTHASELSESDSSDQLNDLII